jgi:hypothetical protein
VESLKKYRKTYGLIKMIYVRHAFSELSYVILHHDSCLFSRQRFKFDV